jgi:hypothetical protein
MADRAENEGFRVLDEFVCDAIPEPGIPQADPKQQGKNEGIRVIEELVFGSESGTKEEGKAEDKEPGDTGSCAKSLPRLVHFKGPLQDLAGQRVAWERLKGLCNEGSLTRGVLEQLCVTVRDRELALLESSGLREAGKSHTARDRVWKAVRSQAVTAARTQAFFGAVRADLRALVQEIENQPDPSRVIANLWPPEIIIQDVAREKFAAQIVEILEALLIDAYV